MLTILGIETSCDDTAVALVTLDGTQLLVCGERVIGQSSDHQAYGGVVPEIAARRHTERLDQLIRELLDESNIDPGQISAIAATSGPGLAGGLVSGVATGKALALVWGCPFLAINHLEGHALSPFLSERLDFPYLLILVSGGHCLIVAVDGLGCYRCLARTRDDAAGEALDKSARVLGLGFPGGAEIERCAKSGNRLAVMFPHPLAGELDMSFSGLKTAVLREARAQELTEQRRADICAGLQHVLCEILGSRAGLAMASFQRDHAGPWRLVLAGGVAANTALRQRIAKEARQAGFDFHVPPVKWCTDNAAMIACAGGLRLLAGQAGRLDQSIRPRWPLEQALLETTGSQTITASQAMAQG